MRIAHLIPQFYPRVGGAEVCVHNICSKLSGSGHQAVVVTTSPPPKNPPNLPYKIEYLWEKTCGMFRRLPKFIGSRYLNYALGKLQDKYSFDLWQVTNGWPLGVFAVDFFRRNAIPCVLRCCGDDIQTFPEINYGVRLDKRIASLIGDRYPLYDVFIANSISMRDEYESLHIPRDRIRIIANGVETGRFKSTTRDTHLRKSIKASSDTHVILTVGRNHPKKGFSIIPQIARELKKSGVDFHWIIAGRGSKDIIGCEQVEEITTIEDCGESEIKDFRLPSEKLMVIYKSADIFVFPSLIEGYPTVCIEAMAAGLPVIGSESPGVRDAIRDGIDGVLIANHAPSAYASAIKKLLKNRQLMDSMSAAAVEKAEKQDWSSVTASYLEAYSEIIARRK